MKLFQYFLSAYNESSYIIQEKNKALFYFLITFLILIPVAMAAFNIVQYQGLFGTANVIMITLLITVIIGLFLIKKRSIQCKCKPSCNNSCTIRCGIYVLQWF